MDGQRMLSLHQETEAFQYDISHWPKGIYVINIIRGTQIIKTELLTLINRP